MPRRYLFPSPSMVEEEGEGVDVLASEDALAAGETERIVPAEEQVEEESRVQQEEAGADEGGTSDHRTVEFIILYSRGNRCLLQAVN